MRWWQLARRRFYCRGCGVQLRAVPTAVGYAVLSILVIVALLSIFALSQGLVGLPSLMFADFAAFAVLAACEMRWGIRLDCMGRSN
jgi:hypothetical protein